MQSASAAESGSELDGVKHGRIQQSVIPWCFNPMKPREIIDVAARLKMPPVVAVLKEKGMTCAIASRHGFKENTSIERRRAEHHHLLGISPRRA